MKTSGTVELERARVRDAQRLGFQSMSSAMALRLDSIFGSAMAAQDRSRAQASNDAASGEVVDFEGRREGAQ